MIRQLSTLTLGGRRVGDDEKCHRDDGVLTSPRPRANSCPLTPRHKQISRRSLSPSSSGSGTRQGSSRPGMMRQLSSLVLGQKGPIVDPAEEAQRLELEAKRSERLQKTATLEASKLEKAKALTELKAELAKLKKKQIEDSYLRKLERDTLRRNHDALAERVQVFKSDMYDKDSLHQYANLIKEAAPNSVDSSYVMRLQKQLSKAMKKMEAMDQQMHTVQISCNDVAASLKQEIGEIIDDRVRSELDLKEQMTELDEKMAALEKEYKDKIKANDLLIDSLQDRSAIGDGTGAIPSDREIDHTRFKKRKDQEEECDAIKEELSSLAVTKGCDENDVREAINRRKEQLVATIKENDLSNVEQLTLEQTEEAEILATVACFEANGVGVANDAGSDFKLKDGGSGNNGGPPIPPPSAFAMSPIGRSTHASDSGILSLRLSDTIEEDEDDSELE